MGSVERWSGASSPVKSATGVGRFASDPEMDEIVGGWEDIVPASTRKTLAKQGVRDVLFEEAVFSRYTDSVWVVPSANGVPSGVVRIHQQGSSWRMSKFAWGVPSAKRNVECESVPFRAAGGFAGSQGEPNTFGDVLLPDLVPFPVESLVRDGVGGEVRSGYGGVRVSRMYGSRGKVSDQLVLWARGGGTAVLCAVRREAKRGKGLFSGKPAASDDVALAAVGWSGEAWVWTPAIRSGAALTARHRGALSS